MSYLTPIERKLGQTAGWNDRQTLFHSTLPATGGGPKNTAAVD